MLWTCCRSSPPTHVTAMVLLGFPSHSPVSSPLLRAFASGGLSKLQSSQPLLLVYHPTLTNTAFVEWLNEYELIVLKVIARGRTHWAHNPPHFRLSEQSNHSSSTPGRRSHMILGVSSNEIGKGYDNYGSEVGRLCSALCILSRFITMM